MGNSNSSLGLKRPPIAAGRWRSASGLQSEIFYLEDGEDVRETRFLLDVRRGGGRFYGAEWKDYSEAVPSLTRRLAARVQQSGKVFDAIVAPPSEHHMAGPYRQAIREQLRIEKDLSNRLERYQKIEPEMGSPLVAVENALAYSRQNDEGRIFSLLFVDDTLCSGNTLTATVKMLREAGLRDDCTISVAVALWLPPKYSG